MADLRTMVRRWAEALGLNERRCWCCGMVAEDAGRPLLCVPCRQRLAPRAAGYCPSCGKIFIDECAEPHTCGDCLRTPPPWGAFAFHGPYDGLLRDLVLDFKFNGRLGVGGLLGALMARAADSLMEPASIGDAPAAGAAYDLVMPVPLHPRRMAARGYNQSLELALGVVDRHGVRLSRTDMVRTRHTLPQSGLSRKDKVRNIRKAFSVPPECVEGKRVLLVDDVMTTGSTVRECTRTLIRAGAEAVGVLVLARTQEDAPMRD